MINLTLANCLIFRAINSPLLKQIVFNEDSDHTKKSINSCSVKSIYFVFYRHDVLPYYIPRR
jgi:hypothetical protein